MLPLMHGFTDIHCHLLPGLDDGAANIEQSLELIENYVRIGFKGAIATPHILDGAYPNTPKTILDAYTLLQSAIDHKSLQFKLSYAAEHMMDDIYLTMLAEKQLLALVKNYILVEMSYLQKPTHLKNTLFKTGLAGYQLILAHPERYVFFNKREQFEDLKNRGCLFQLNALSLSDHYGEEVQKKAELLLKLGLYDYIGTDCHAMRHIDKLEKLEFNSSLKSPVQQLVDNTIKLSSE